MDLDLATLALDKLIKEKAGKTARDNVAVGRHPVDFIARIVGTLNVAPNGTRDCKTEVNYKRAFAFLADLLVKRFGLDESIAEDVIRSVVGSALGNDSANETIETIIGMVDKELTDVVKTVPCRGRVTTSLAVEFEDETVPVEVVAA